ncbi:MAG: Mu transposase domain-containing protein [Planctomycetota bacterium]
MKLVNQEKLLKTAAAKAGMSEKTARKYRKSGKLPSQCKVIHDWRTRPDPLDPDDWRWAEEVLGNNDGIEAKTLLEVLQREHPGKYQDGQLRTFQRRVKLWRALKGPGNEVFFPQVYTPGEWCESDFTRMKSLSVTINGIVFDHMLYHFVFSESYESLSAGLQNALWKLGGVPKYHRTDNLTSAVNPVGNPEVFTANYQGLAKHYGFESHKIQPGCPNENGDIEKRHDRLKKTVDQALMLRGSRDFASRDEYEQFLQKLFDQLNSGRKERLKEELVLLYRLPRKRHDDYTEIECKVTRFSTIRVLKNSYSLHSRLIGERVKARVYADHIDVWYAQRRIEVLPRLRGENGHYINYRHIIDWLVRKPGAFENYRYKDDLFPTSQFRIAYDLLCSEHGPKQGNKHYLKILKLAAHESQTLVNESLRFLINRADQIDSDIVEAMVKSGLQPPAVTDVEVEQVDLGIYDELLEYQEALTA